MEHRQITPIELNGNNYSEFTPLDIVAFSYAAPGAMGERGGIKIVTRDAKL